VELAQGEGSGRERGWDYAASEVIAQGFFGYKRIVEKLKWIEIIMN
jgi:hypothetical protein